MPEETKYPVIDDVYVRRVFDILSNMDVELDSDPIAFGPKRLNGKVAQCRDYLSKCQRVYLQLADDLGRLNRAHRQSKLDFDLRMQDLFANDPDVRSGKNVRDREAVATMKLRDERETTTRLESAIQDLDAVLTVVKAKREDLKDVQGRIRDQVKLCQEEIGLGERWGSSPIPGTRIDLDRRPLINTAALEAMHDALGDMDGDTSISDLDKFVEMELTIQGRASEIEAPAKAVSQPIEELGVSVREPETVGAITVKEPEITVKEPETVATPVEEDEPEATPVEDADLLASILPEVKITAPPIGSTTDMGDLDSYLDDLTVPAKATGKNAASPPPVAAIDIDDLLSGLD